MVINQITNFEIFCSEMIKIGFCLSGENGEDIFSLNDFYSGEIEAHTGDRDLDPWAWRIRALREKDYLCYGKFFMKKAGWITREWITDFVCVRRKGLSVETLYEDGLIGAFDREIYNQIKLKKRLSVNQLNEDFGKDKKKDVAKALSNLQMLLLIVVCDDTFKISKEGVPYGWPVTVFSTIEDFVDADISERAKELDFDETYDRIIQQIYVLNPKVTDRKIKAFVKKMI